MLTAVHLWNSAWRTLLGEFMKSFAIAIALAGLSAPAAAQVSVFSDSTAFVSATGTNTVVDFTNTPHFPISSGVLSSATREAGLAAGDIPAGVTFSTPVGAGNFFNIDVGGGFTGGFLDSFGADRVLTISFDSPQQAFGFDTNFLMEQFIVTIFSGADPLFSQTFTAPGSNMTFFGFASLGSGITSATINGTAGSANFALDNFRFGAAAQAPAVPEPGTWAMLLMGFGAMGAALRRQRRRLAGSGPAIA